MGSMPSLDEFEPKLLSLVRFDRGVVELEQQWRTCRQMLQIGALVQGLRDLALRWKDFFTWELHLESLPLQEWVIEVVREPACLRPCEDWTATGRLGGTGPPGAAHRQKNAVQNNCADANFKLVSRVRLMALPRKRHLVGHKDFAEFRDHHVLETSSWLVAKKLGARGSRERPLGHRRGLRTWCEQKRRV